MKKFYKYCILLIAAFLFAPLTAMAQQNDPADPTNPIAGLGFTKKVTEDPNRLNGYNITLTAFVTGSTTSTSDIEVASDIVLVLDVSGSMLEGAGANVTTLELNTLYAFESSGQTTRYGKVFEHNGKYYLRYGLDSNSPKKTDSPTAWNAGGSGVWSGYDGVTTMPGVPSGWTAKKSRITLMQEATKAFYQTVLDKQTTGTNSLRHRIAVVKFGYSRETSNYNGCSQIYPNSSLAEVTSGNQSAFESVIDGLVAAGATQANTGLSIANTILSNASSSGRAQVVVFFTDGSPTSGGGFEADVAREAVNNAYSIKDRTTYLRNINGDLIKVNNANVPLESKVYSVGLLTSESTNNNNNNLTIRRFMHYVSSNYKFQINGYSYDFTSNHSSSKKLVNTGTEENPEWEYTGGNGGNEAWSEASGPQYYQRDETGENLKSIFESIASSSATSPTIDFEFKESDMVAVDIVSNHFKLPDNAQPSMITIKVAPFDHIDTDGSYTDAQRSRNEHYKFGTPVEYSTAVNNTARPCAKAYEPLKVDGVIQRDAQGKIRYTNTELTPTAHLSNNNLEITVDGFNYVDNWCGYDVRTNPNNNETTNIPHGYQLVIIIPIEVDPANPGSATEETNAQGSGIRIYSDDGKTYTSAAFPMPSVVLPNIIIRKFGLKYKDEAASFRLEKLKLKTGGTASNPEDWEVDTSVSPYKIVVVSQDDEPNTYDMVQVKLQQPGRYRVTETDWGWSYICTTGTVSTPQAEAGMTDTDVATATNGLGVMKEFNKDGKLVDTVVDNPTNGQPSVIRDVSGNTEQTIILDASTTNASGHEVPAQLSGAVFDFKNTLKTIEVTTSQGSITQPIEHRNYSEAHKLNEFHEVTNPE